MDLTVRVAVVSWIRLSVAFPEVERQLGGGGGIPLAGTDMLAAGMERGSEMDLEGPSVREVDRERVLGGFVG